MAKQVVIVGTGPVGHPGATGPGGEGYYTNPTPTPYTLGGIPAGTTFQGMSMSQVLDMLLYPYQPPSFSSFSIQSYSSALEVGATTTGGPVFLWNTLIPANIVPGSIQITDAYLSTLLVSGLGNSGSYTGSITPVTKILPATYPFQISGTSVHSAAFQATASFNWQWRLYHGESASTTLDAAGIQGLRLSYLSAAYAGTRAFVSGGYKYVCYPATLGTATSFKDSSTNFDVPFQGSYQVSVTNSFGISTYYNVHRSVNVLGASLNIIVS